MWYLSAMVFYPYATDPYTATTACRISLSPTSSTPFYTCTHTHLPYHTICIYSAAHYCEYYFGHFFSSIFGSTEVSKPRDWLVGAANP